MLNILMGPGEFSFVEKHSRFIGQCGIAATEDEAREALANARARHGFASHHAFAFSLSQGNLIRVSDGGEPHGTAGLPIHKVFQGKSVIDYICVVTRYFGGVLLGSGGLARAYAKAAKGALDAAGLTERITYRVFDAICEYRHLARIRHAFGEWGVEVESIDYSECCVMRVRMRDDSVGLFQSGGLYEYVEVV